MEENNLNKDYLLRVTNELYRVTLLFPKREPLRYKMRDLADDVLADFVSLPWGSNQPSKITIIKNSDKALEVLDSFFDIAKSQNWVNPAEMLNLQREYSKIRQELVKFKRQEKDSPASEKSGKEKEETAEEVKEISVFEKVEVKPVPERQQKILSVLKEKGQMQVWEIKNILSDVSKRTLRRDFKNLVKNNLVERIGERNNTFYKIRNKSDFVKVGQA